MCGSPETRPASRSWNSKIPEMPKMRFVAWTGEPYAGAGPVWKYQMAPVGAVTEGCSHHALAQQDLSTLTTAAMSAGTVGTMPGTVVAQVVVGDAVVPAADLAHAVVAAALAPAIAAVAHDPHPGTGAPDLVHHPGQGPGRTPRSRRNILC